MTLDPEMAARLARIALDHVVREYPHKLDHVLAGDGDALPPRTLHPAFYGSFDWHSCVHGWWTLLTLIRLSPDIAEAEKIAALADRTFTPEKIAAELAYLERPFSRGFERPYGWAWLLHLHLESAQHSDRRWGEALVPLANAFADRLRDYVGILAYPIRVGTHFNTAFALILATQWAHAFDHPLEQHIRERAAGWFGNDRDCQAWEPGGDEFLSPALIEALCMARVLPPADFERWFAAFLPRLPVREPAALFTPAIVSDRSDGKIAHLDGLNLSRGWCWRGLAPLLAPDASALALQTSREHLDAALPHLAGDYMGEHWLASFALLALLAE